MKAHTVFAVLAVGTMALTQHAHAHGFAGDHMFVSTLIIDDPNVADEASIPTFIYLPQPTEGGPAPGLYATNFEFDKRITENFGFGLSSGYNWLTQSWRQDRQRLVEPPGHVEIQGIRERRT